MTIENLHQIIANMSSLGFKFHARRGISQYEVTFEEIGGRPDRIAQSATDKDFLIATDLAAKKIVDFVKMVGPGWETRPIKRTPLERVKEL